LKYRYSIALFFVGFILQSTVLNHFAILGVSPNIILCLVVIFSFLYEGNHGLILGPVFGMINDICFAEIIGVSALSYFLVALLCLELKRYLYKDSWVSMMIVSSAGTVCFGLLYWGTTRILGNGVHFLYVLKLHGILLAYNVMVTIIMYHFMSRRVIKHRSDRYMYRGNLQEARSLYRS
jgi:rod shape-determining protein MreD